MTTFEINGALYEAVPLTVLSEARFRSLANRIHDVLAKSTDEDEQFIAAEYSGYIRIYAKCVVVLTQSEFNFPQHKAPIEGHVAAFLKWVDQDFQAIIALNEAVENAIAPPGDKVHVPDSELTEGEKKVSQT